MKLAIIGSRGFDDFDFMEQEVKRQFTNLIGIDTIVSGGARGADTLGELLADKYSIPKKIFLADWNKHGKKAGYIRNVDIIKNADFVLAFWDGQSRGTKHAIELALRTFYKPFKVINYKDRKDYHPRSQRQQ